MLRIVTDSASDITLAEAEKMGISIVPLTITFPDGTCPQETEEDFEIFYQRLAACADLPTTSQPPLEEYIAIYEQAQAAGDDVLVITLSGGLSGTVRAAEAAKQVVGYDRVFIVDSHQAIISQRIMVELALKLRDQSMTTEEIADRLVQIRDRVTVSGVVDTLTYLRKGGRIPASMAILGNAINLKPVIVLQDTILKAVGKAMGRKAGIRMLYDRIEKFPPDLDYPILFGYAADRELGEQFMKDTVEAFGFPAENVRMYPVGGVIGTHVGNKCLAISYVMKE